MDSKKGHKDIERSLFEKSKEIIAIGIYGSFYGNRKKELIQLRDYLRESGYKNARISEDFDERVPNERIQDFKYDRYLSKKLIDESEVHIFVLSMPSAEDPGNLNESALMELERLTTLVEDKRKMNQGVMLLLQSGLRKNIKNSLGSVCKGLLEEKEDTVDVYLFTQLKKRYKTAYQFCYRCLEGKMDKK